MMSACRATIATGHLSLGHDGRYSIGPGVQTDLDLFDRRVSASVCEPRHEEAADLALSALELYTGPVFHHQGADRDSFAWIEAANLTSHWELKITKVAEEVAERCLDQDDTGRAIRACEAGR